MRQQAWETCQSGVPSSRKKEVRFGRGEIRAKRIGEGLSSLGAPLQQRVFIRADAACATTLSVADLDIVRRVMTPEAR